MSPVWTASLAIDSARWSRHWQRTLPRRCARRHRCSSAHRSRDTQGMPTVSFERPITAHSAIVVSLLYSAAEYDAGPSAPDPTFGDTLHNTFKTVFKDRGAYCGYLAAAYDVVGGVDAVTVNLSVASPALLEVCIHEFSGVTGFEAAGGNSGRRSGRTPWRAAPSSRRRRTTSSSASVTTKEARHPGATWRSYLPSTRSRWGLVAHRVQGRFRHGRVRRARNTHDDGVAYGHRCLQGSVSSAVYPG